jgi:transcriptional regulator with XRE-family HTH domain
MAPLPLKDALRAAIKARGLTQAGLAARLGVKQPVVGRLLTGERRVVTGSLARVLDELELEMFVELRPKVKPNAENAVIENAVVKDTASTAELELAALEADSVADMVAEIAALEADLPPGQHETWLAAFLRDAKPLGDEWRRE